jgi:predicted dienelactone hydrolase
MKVGYKEWTVNELDICVYYPTSEHQNREKAQWHPNWDYAKTIYESIHIDPRKKRTLPLWLVKFCISYLKTYRQNAYINAKLAPMDRSKVILMSHGLAAHKNMMSCYASWYASRGYIVVSLEHRNDEVCVDFRPY